ncbi:VOC family protein, partial [Hansschlegelia beijingensis]
MTTTLDHVVVNALRGMDAAAETFAALGFTLTPLGRHSLGSINHLMVAPGAYLELVAVPETGKQRQEVLDSPFGLSGLVFKTDDADAAYQRLSAAGLSPTEPVAFSRPVEIDGE